MKLEQEVERWRAVKGYEGLYSISSFGRVYSRERTRQWKGFIHKVKGKILIEYINIKNPRYASVSLAKDSSKKTFNVHNLVAIAFIPNPYNLPCINHIDGNKINNNINNLEWVSYRENSCHSSNSFKNTSNYTGVSIKKTSKKYISHITIKGKLKYLGAFDTEIEAYQARIDGEKLYNIKNKYL